MAEGTSGPVRRLPRAQRREQILAAATKAFARNGFAATGLDDIAAEAGITRVILYRHFDSKTDLYQAVLDRFCAVLSDHVAEPVGGFTDASIDGLLKAAIAEPAGFRLLFAARRPGAGVQGRAPSSSDPTSPRRPTCRSRQIVADEAWARWAAQLAPTAAIEAIIAWLDAGQPDPDLAADRVRHVIAGVITAAAARSGLGLPAPNRLTAADPNRWRTS